MFEEKKDFLVTQGKVSSSGTTWYLVLVVEHATIDLFTDKVAILNLLDLMSIMGCPGAWAWSDILAQYLSAL